MVKALLLSAHLNQRSATVLASETCHKNSQSDFDNVHGQEHVDTSSRDAVSDLVFHVRVGARVVFQVATDNGEKDRSAHVEEGILEKLSRHPVGNHILDFAPNLELSNAQRLVDTECTSMIPPLSTNSASVPRD